MPPARPRRHRTPRGRGGSGRAPRAGVLPLCALTTTISRPSSPKRRHSSVRSVSLVRPRASSERCRMPSSSRRSSGSSCPSTTLENSMRGDRPRSGRRGTSTSWNDCTARLDTRRVHARLAGDGLDLVDGPPALHRDHRGHPHPLELGRPLQDLPHLVLVVLAVTLPLHPGEYSSPF
jgi:hypothetical protein